MMLARWLSAPERQRFGVETWRHCQPCDVAWEGAQTRCWFCGAPTAASSKARPDITSNVQLVSAMRDHQWRAIKAEVWPELV